MSSYLAIPGIRGNAGARGHVGEIEVESTRFSGGNPGTLSVTKWFDDATAALNAALASGKIFGSVLLTRDGGETGSSSVVSLNFATVTSFHSGADTESLTLSFESASVLSREDPYYYE